MRMRPSTQFRAETRNANCAGFSTVNPKNRDDIVPDAHLGMRLRLGVSSIKKEQTRLSPDLIMFPWAAPQPLQRPAPPDLRHELINKFMCEIRPQLIHQL